jgi:two-component system, LytTR family, response regulator
MKIPDPIRALLVDDEAPARSRFRHLLKLEPDVRIVGECGGGREAVEALRRETVDVLFLDIQMPGVNGFEVCAEIGVEHLPLVVFVTAYDQFALKAFEVHALDYLLKPVAADRLRFTLEHIRARLREPTRGLPDERITELLAELRAAPRERERLGFKIDGKVVLIATADMDWLEADGNYVQVHAGGKAHMVRETLSALEAELPARQFMRISRSVLVNLDAVRELQPLFYGDYAVLLKDGARLTLSRSHRECVEKLLARGDGAGRIMQEKKER